MVAEASVIVLETIWRRLAQLHRDFVVTRVYPRTLSMLKIAALLHANGSKAASAGGPGGDGALGAGVSALVAASASASALGAEAAGRAAALTAASASAEERAESARAAAFTAAGGGAENAKKAGPKKPEVEAPIRKQDTFVQGKWRYKLSNEVSLVPKTMPDHSSAALLRARKLDPGEIFTVTERRVGEGQTYLKLQKGGWAFTHHPTNGMQICQLLQSTSSSSSSSSAPPGTAKVAEQTDEGYLAKFQGVSKVNGRYRARIEYGGKKHSLGTHDTEEQAAKAYATARLHRELHRENSAPTRKRPRKEGEDGETLPRKVSLRLPVWSVCEEASRLPV
jgi:hypothetical protein